LFEYEFVPYEAEKSILGFSKCESCGDRDGGYWDMKVDSDWRRLLRDLRLNRVPRESPNTTIEVSVSDSGTTELEANPNPQSVAASDVPESRVGGARDWPYRIVCAVMCEDGVCVGWVYENDSMDEPELPPYRTSSEGTIDDLSDTEDSGDKWPSQNMPGAFRD